MLRKITERVYYKDYVQASDRPVLGLIVGDTSCLVVDGGNSKAHAEEFLTEIKELNVPPIHYVALTHWHWDHVFGVTTIGAKTIAEERTNERLQWLDKLEWTNEAIEQRVVSGEEIQFCYDHILVEMPNDNREIEIPKADIIYRDALTIDLGGVTVQLQHVGGDHAHDSVVVHVVEEKVVFVGDCLYLDMYHGEWSYQKEKLFPLLETLASYQADYYIPCHHDLYTNETFLAFKKFLMEIGNLVGEIVNLEEVLEKAQKMKKRELTEEEIENIGAFVAGNKKK
ncbi:MAG: MBL fold metallo-hydrolase [Bacillaceae bacterium]